MSDSCLKRALHSYSRALHLRLFPPLTRLHGAIAHLRGQRCTIATCLPNIWGDGRLWTTEQLYKAAFLLYDRQHPGQLRLVPLLLRSTSNNNNSEPQQHRPASTLHPPTTTSDQHQATTTVYSDRRSSRL